jgi:hypothetical protein
VALLPGASYFVRSAPKDEAYAGARLPSGPFAKRPVMESPRPGDGFEIVFLPPVPALPELQTIVSGVAPSFLERHSTLHFTVMPLTTVRPVFGIASVF